MKHFIEKHFGLVLLVACIIGLVFLPLAQIPNVSVVVALAILMLVSCYRLRDGGFESISWRAIARFYLLRYVLLPPALWFIAHQLAPAYATGVFLLSLLPAGVASPAFAAIFGGTVAPAFALVILSQILTPFLIPLQFAWLGDVGTAPHPGALFMTMVWCIFVPMLVYYAIRRHHPSAHYIYRQSKCLSVLLVAFVIAMAIAKQREVILSGQGLIGAWVITSLCFLIYIAFGWLVNGKRPNEERIAFTACSGFNNAALGVSLALLHFPPPVILFVAVSEIGWALLPFMLKGFLRCVGKP